MLSMEETYKMTCSLAWLFYAVSEIVQHDIKFIILLRWLFTECDITTLVTFKILFGDILKSP